MSAELPRRTRCTYTRTFPVSASISCPKTMPTPYTLERTGDWKNVHACVHEY